MSQGHTSSPSPGGGFGEQLRDLADRTAFDLAQRHASRRASRATRRCLPLLLAVPVLYLLWAGLRWLTGPAGSVVRVDSFGDLFAGAIAVGLLALLPLLAAVGFFAWRAYDERTSRRRALAVLDRHLGLADRLVTADEFLDLAGASGFELAAIEDAHAVVSRARGAVLPQVPYRWPTDRRSLVLVAAALVLVGLAGSVHVGGPTSARADGPLADGDASSAEVARTERRASGGGHSESERTPVPPETRREPRDRRPQSAVRAEARATDVPDSVKQSKGATREGESSDAQASSGAGSAKGTPSNQEQKSEGAAESQRKPKKPTATDEARDDDAPERKQADEDSGSTAGRGSAKGSSKNAVATPWSSKDQVDTPDDQQIDDDDEFEDDAEEQKARGGMQPNLRDRRPPVSRDLSIGFGNRPSPDANGRGGPSQPKKSRGTASLVLGVPVPDRVKGQPNRGKTKITQERVEPRAEDSDPVRAAERTPSSQPLGRIPAPHASPFVRDAVRRYFLALRARESADAN